MNDFLLTITGRQAALQTRCAGETKPALAKGLEAQLEHDGATV